MKTNRNIFLILLPALLIIGFTSYISIGSSYAESSIECINSMLYDLNIELDLLEHYRSKYKDDKVLEEKLNHLVLNKMIAISVAKPDIKKLKGVPIEALHRLIIATKSDDLFNNFPDNIYQVPLEYLLSIEEEVNSILHKRNAIHKKPFK